MDPILDQDITPKDYEESARVLSDFLQFFAIIPRLQTVMRVLGSSPQRLVDYRAQVMAIRAEQEALIAQAQATQADVDGLAQKRQDGERALEAALDAKQKALDEQDAQHSAKHEATVAELDRTLLAAEARHQDALNAMSQKESAAREDARKAEAERQAAREALEASIADLQTKLDELTASACLISTHAKELAGKAQEVVGE